MHILLNHSLPVEGNSMCIKVEHVKEEGGPLNHTEIQRTWCRPEEPSRLNVDIVFVLTNNINLM